MSEPIASPLTLRARGAMTDDSGRSYHLIRLLGSGGFGTVYLAEQVSSGGLVQRVALKLLRRDLDAQSRAPERMREEAIVLSRIRHPVILAAHDLVTFDGQLGLVTEYVEGEDLSACIAEPIHPLPAAAVLEVVGQVASALDTAWRRLQLVHRDIKPQNIRLGVHGSVKLLDFGIAWVGGAERQVRTETHLVVGTYRYLAPERFTAGRPPEPPSDVFALGAVLFEGLTRTPLLAGVDLFGAASLATDPGRHGAHVQERLACTLAGTEATAALPSPIPPPVRDLVARMVAWDPADRPTAGAVVEACESLLPGVGGARLSTWARSHPWPDPEEPAAPTEAPPPDTRFEHHGPLELD
ncbi:MAG: serine/threonine-protein kinase, partial [Myxococcota bacterium]